MNTIHREFIKHAFWWSKLSPAARKLYVHNHPKSKLLGARVIYEQPNGKRDWGTVKKIKNNIVKILEDSTNQHVNLPMSAIIASEKSITKNSL